MAAAFTTSVLADDFDWSEVLHTETNAIYKTTFTPFDSAQNELMNQYSVPGEAETTSGGVTVKVNRILGDRYQAYIVIDIINDNGKPFKGDKYSIYPYYMKMDALGLPRPVRMFDQDYRITGNEDNYFTGCGAVLEFINEDTTDNKIQMICHIGSDQTSGTDYNYETIIGKKVVFHLEDIAEVASGTRDFSDIESYKSISNGVWDLEVVLDYPDISKEYEVNSETFTAYSQGRDRKMRVDKALITPLCVYVKGYVERRDGERVGGEPVLVKMRNGKITKDLSPSVLGSTTQCWATPIDGLIDLENEGDGVQALVMGGHEISLK